MYHHYPTPDNPRDGEVRIRPANGGWIVTTYSHLEPKADPEVEEAIRNLRVAAGNSWSPEEAIAAASEILSAKTGYGSYANRHAVLSSDEAVFETLEGLMGYLREIALEQAPGVLDGCEESAGETPAKTSDKGGCSHD